MNKKTYNDIDETIYYNKLENGLTVFLLPKKEMTKTYSLFTTNYGSIDKTFVPDGGEKEITVTDGIAHFLEHKLFEKEDRDVFADFGKQGASANAYTSFTKTAYLFSATNNVEQNLLTLLDFVQEPYFSDQSVEKEKGIIGQEIKMYDDQSDWQSFMGTIKGMFQHHPVKNDIAGTVESISSITKEDLYACYNTFYHPHNMTLFIAGNIDAEQIMKLIETNQRNKSFSKMNEIERNFPEEPERVAMPENKIILPVSIPKCTIGIKESSTELSKEDFLFRDIMQDMVLDYYFSQGGEFYQELYDDNLIDDSFSYSTTLERNFGYSLIGGNSNQPDVFANKVKELLLRTNNSSFEQKEFDTMKKKRIGRLLRSMNSLEYIANQYTHYHEFDIDLFEIIPFIQSISFEEANAFLQSWINEHRITVCKIESQ